MARIGEDKYNKPAWAPDGKNLDRNQGMMQMAGRIAGTQAERVANGEQPFELKSTPGTINRAVRPDMEPGVNGDQTRGGSAGAGTGNGGGYTQDPYAAQANALYQQLMSRGPFQYDLQGDMLYRQYADQYSQLGKQAMMDTMGTAAGLTGGYGNSYASTVGNQAYQQYLGQLNAMIPDFYDRAYQRWQDQGDDLLTQYQLALERSAASGGGGGGSRSGNAYAPGIDITMPAYGDDVNALLAEAVRQTTANGTYGAIPAGVTLTPEMYNQALLDYMSPDFDYYSQYYDAMKKAK